MDAPKIEPSMQDSKPDPQVQPDFSVPEGERRRDNHGRRFGRNAVAVTIVVIVALFLYTIRIFFVPIILAGTFTVLFYPLYRWMLKVLRGNRVISSLLCCFVLVLGVLLPLYGGVVVVGNQAVDLVRESGPQVRQVVHDFTNGVLQVPQIAGLAERLKLVQMDWKTPLNNSLASFGAAMTQVIARTSAGLFELVFVLVTMLFIMFYLFVDGERIVRRFRRISPLPHRYEDVMFKRFVLVSRATVRGTLVVGLIQGTLGGLTLLVFGVKSWVVWGMVMVIMAILPLMGTWMVLVPAGIVRMMLGHPWQGMGIIIVGVVVVSFIDNIIRPRVVGQDAKLHDLLVFFSTIGGIAVFGPMGFIVGPVIAALFVAMVEIYGYEFGRHAHEERLASEAAPLRDG
jgi:predicted PurR-regulated permease PerM